ncbi:outer membrane protein assembly factor BamB [Denitromonas ohlonensis]|uniref:Outer membrane protein assembly factor BamB n=2 Tax=Denitromonas TaxID=139331 RepID=A0A557RCP7_9RHOO|nr:outer membrane protein assembly factor BamB [Denitromonas ohlonensis]TVO62930.1 outer membrane protein assembly factor BamB [Denitromonas ohlonensis]TVO74953.1 outer membrane protein assembly factor BamB [Denitromonas ohlonensis]
MRSFRLFTALAATSLLVGCSSLDALNPFSTPAPKMAPLPEFKASATLSPVWSAKIGEADIYRFEPAVLDSEVIAAGAAGDVARFSGGQTRWRVRVDGGLTAGVGADADLAVVANGAGEVVALDASSGAERWRAKVNAEVLAAPGVAKDFVVVRSSDNRVFGLDRKDGAIKWTYRRTTPALTLRNPSGMLLENNVAVLGFPGGKLAALDLNNGGLIWELSVALPAGATELERIADVVGDPVLHRQTLCAAAFQGRVSCFDVTNGKTLWSRPVSARGGMSRDVRQVYVTEDTDAVAALDAFSGASMWRQDQLVRRVLTAPLATSAGVVVGDTEGYVHLLSLENGAFIGRTQADSSGVSVAPRALGELVLVQTRAGGIHVFQPR